MARVTDPSFKFWFDEKYYTVQGAETMARMGKKDDLSTMRAEYTRMRDVAQKRVARLQKMFPETVGAKHKYDTGKTDSEGNPIYKSGFPTLKTLDPRDFPKAFAELAKFVKAKGSTVTGQKQIQQKTIETINKATGNADENGNSHGGLTKENYWRFIKILEEARRQKITYDSDKMVSLAETTLELSNDQFDSILEKLAEFIEHSDEVGNRLSDYMKDKNIQGYQQVDMDDFISQIGW
jgi:hypothetical protein